MSSATMIGKQIGNYKVTRLLGEGGMGAVFLGEHPMIGKKVAIKTLHDELAQKQDIVDRFFNEAKAVNAIGHENIVDVVDFGKMKDDTGNDVVYFVMEFLEGESLTDRLKKGTLSFADSVGIIAQCASALSASHAKGIVHRDLKPDNIHLIKRGSTDNFVKLLDFGIAKLTGEGASNKTRAGSVLGTPAYMSPEQCDGRGNIDHRSDVYSLGMVLYELCTGRVAFTGEGFGEILVAQITLPAPPPSHFNPNIPPQLEQIILKCLEKDREHRFQNMAELKDALEATGLTGQPARPITSLNKIIDETPGHARPTALGSGPGGTRVTTLSGSTGEAQPAGGAQPKSGGSTGMILGLVAVLAVGGGGAGFYFLKMKNQPAPQPAVVTQPVTPPPAPKKETVDILVDSTPQGAKVMRAGVSAPLGVTPYKMTLKKGEPAFDVVLTLDGYKTSATRTISTDRDADVLLVLEKEPAPTPVASKPEKTEKHHGGERDHKLPNLGDDIKPLPDKPTPKVDPDGVLAPQL